MSEVVPPSEVRVAPDGNAVVLLLPGYDDQFGKWIQPDTEGGMLRVTRLPDADVADWRVVWPEPDAEPEPEAEPGGEE